MHTEAGHDGMSNVVFSADGGVDGTGRDDTYVPVSQPYRKSKGRKIACGQNDQQQLNDDAREKKRARIGEASEVEGLVGRNQDMDSGSTEISPERWESGTMERPPSTQSEDAAYALEGLSRSGGADANPLSDRHPYTPDSILKCLRPCFEMPLKEAAAHLGYSEAWIKNLRKRAGIPKWPYLEIRGLRREIDELEVKYISYFRDGYKQSYAKSAMMLQKRLESFLVTGFDLNEQAKAQVLRQLDAKYPLSPPTSSRPTSSSHPMSRPHRDMAYLRGSPYQGDQSDWKNLGHPAVDTMAGANAMRRGLARQKSAPLVLMNPSMDMVPSTTGTWMRQVPQQQTIEMQRGREGVMLRPRWTSLDTPTREGRYCFSGQANTLPPIRKVMASQLQKRGWHESFSANEDMRQNETRWGGAGES